MAASVPDMLQRVCSESLLWGVRTVNRESEMITFTDAFGLTLTSLSNIVSSFLDVASLQKSLRTFFTLSFISDSIARDLRAPNAGHFFPLFSLSSLVLNNFGFWLPCGDFDIRLNLSSPSLFSLSWSEFPLVVSVQKIDAGNQVPF